MSTIINTPRTDDSSGAGLLIGIVLVIVLGALFIMYSLPMIRQNAAPRDNGVDVNVTLPTTPDNTTNGNTTPTPAQ